MRDINCDKLTKKYFYFLVEEYNFTCEDGTFKSNSVTIEISYGRNAPFITLLPKDEPQFSKICMNWFFYYYTEDFDNVLKSESNLENATKKYSDLFREYADTIIHKVTTWWLPVQRYRLETMENDFGEKLEMFQSLYDYVEKKTNI